MVATVRRRPCPPDRVRGWCPRCRVRWNCSSSSSTRAAGVPPTDSSASTVDATNWCSGFWNTYPTGCRPRLTGCPHTVAWVAVEPTSPASADSSDDFPAPLGPIRATNSPPPSLIVTSGDRPGTLRPATSTWGSSSAARSSVVSMTGVSCHPSGPRSKLRTAPGAQKSVSCGTGPGSVPARRARGSHIPASANSSRCRLKTSSGGPQAMVRPSASSARTWSTMGSAGSRSWSMTTTPMPSATSPATSV